MLLFPTAWVPWCLPTHSEHEAAECSLIQRVWIPNKTQNWAKERFVMQQLWVPLQWDFRRWPRMVWRERCLVRQPRVPKGVGFAQEFGPLSCSAWPQLLILSTGRHGAVGGPEGHQKDQRDGTALLRGQSERAGDSQPGEKKTPVRSCFSTWRELIKKMKTKFLIGPLVVEHGAMFLNWKKRKIQAKYKEEFCYNEGSKTLEHTAQRGGKWFIPGNIQGQDGTLSNLILLKMKQGLISGDWTKYL